MYFDNWLDVRKKEYDICFLIVVYGCDIERSSTIKSILRNAGVLKDSNVCIAIWNNGPYSQLKQFKEFSEREIGWRVDVIFNDCLDNMPLSMLYNSVIERVAAIRYCIFDHDSLVGEDYFHAINTNHAVDVLVPRIVANSAVRGPLFKKNIVRRDGPLLIDGDNDFFSISSGLCITSNVVSAFKQCFDTVFDENYALYGVDTSFCIRLCKVHQGRALTVGCYSEIQHSLSRLEKEPIERRRFRAKERGLDLGITLRRYFSIMWVGAVIKSFIRAILGRGVFSLKWIVIGFLKGRHPSCDALLSDAER